MDWNWVPDKFMYHIWRVLSEGFDSNSVFILSNVPANHKLTRYLKHVYCPWFKVLPKSESAQLSLVPLKLNQYSNIILYTCETLDLRGS